MNLFRIHKINLRAENVCSNIDQHGTRTSGSGDQESLPDYTGQVFNFFDQIVMLGNRRCNTGDIRFLEGVPANGLGRYLSAEYHQRNRVHIGRRNTCNHVAYTRSRSSEAYAGTAGSAGVAVCRMHRSLLMSGQDVAGEPGLIQLIV